MKYRSHPAFQHGTADKTAVLLINLGTPDAPDTASVRRYLQQFLSDPRIIEMPRWRWMPILHGIILRRRPARSAEAYRSVWSETDGSPLLSISQRQRDALQQWMSDNRQGVRVELAMRYGSPSIESVLNRLAGDNVRRLCLLPMYPQYSGTTTASALDEVFRWMRATRWLPEIRVINDYWQHPGWIEALAASIREHWAQQGQSDLLVMSYHGIPTRYWHNGDPYYCHCQGTSRLLADALGLEPSRYRVVFQSRVGREPWLQPYCDETMQSLPGEGFKKIDVVCPGFSADCLETIEEIAEENRHYFLGAGGEQYHYIACLNDRPDHIAALGDLVVSHLQGWPDAGEDQAKRSLTESAQRARAHGQQIGIKVP